MSLKTWYPFDGNITNYGLGSKTYTTSGTITYNTGKLTKQCLGTGSGYVKLPYTDFQTNEITIAAWLNPNTTSLWTDAISFGINNNRIELSNSEGRYTWYCDDSATALMTSGTNLGTIPVGEWHHIAVTANGSKVFFYLDGVLQFERAQLSSVTTAFGTSQEFRIGCRYTTGSQLWKGSVNDFRVYDSCLSPREIKQLAQGLAWHCKMNTISNPNLITTMSAGGRTTLNGKYSLIADYATNQDTYGYFNVSPALVLDKTYTLSFDVKNLPSGAVWGWQLWNDADYSFTVTKNGHYEYTFTPTAAKLPTDYSLTKFLFDDGGRTNPANLVTFYNFKIEEGSSSTQWCPHSSDTAPYSIFSSNSNKELDCSGYRHDSLRYGVTGDGQSARYLHCGKFGGGSYIRSDSMYTVGWTDFTMSAWVNPSSYTATGGSVDRQTIIIGGMYLTLANGIVSTYCYGKTSKYYDGKTKIPLNEWSHIAVTYHKNGTLKIYVNGALDATYTGLIGACEDQQFHKQKEIGAETNGSSRHYSGKISDVRIYATALSDADMKDLYNIATTYTEKGTFLTYEIDGASSAANIKYYPSNTKAEEFSEIGYSGGMKTKVLSDGSAWARIHWLDVTNDNTYFANNDEVAFCDKKNRFSRMGLIDYFKSYAVPKGYTKLQYIESTGTQYIDTNYYWKSEAVKVYMDAHITSNSAYQSLFGNEEKRADGGDRYFAIIPHGSGGSFGIYTGIGSVITVSPGVGSRFTLECETTSSKSFTAKVNGSTVGTATYSGTVMTYSNTPSTDASKGKIYIFSNHNSSSGAAAIQNIGGMKLYAFKMYDNGVLVRDFIPCKNSQGAIGLLDKVHDVFYPNAGSGTFTAGPIASTTETDTGVYEFMLTYPRISSTGYNRWTQTSSPNASTVTGFVSKVGTWTQEAHSGLRKHETAAVYDCDSGDPWYAPIGQKSQWTTGKYIPSASGSSTTETELWVRIDNLPKLNKISMLDNKIIQAFEIKEL